MNGSTVVLYPLKFGLGKEVCKDKISVFMIKK